MKCERSVCLLKATSQNIRVLETAQYGMEITFKIKVQSFTYNKLLHITMSTQLLLESLTYSL